MHHCIWRICIVTNHCSQWLLGKFIIYALAHWRLVKILFHAMKAYCSSMCGLTFYSRLSCPLLVHCHAMFVLPQDALVPSLCDYWLIVHGFVWRTNFVYVQSICVSFSLRRLMPFAYQLVLVWSAYRCPLLQIWVVTRWEFPVLYKKLNLLASFVRSAIILTHGFSLALASKVFARLNLFVCRRWVSNFLVVHDSFAEIIVSVGALVI